MTTTADAALAEQRPRRGRPEDTRKRLIAAAARCFDREGYFGTDSNRIAQTAGYAAGTFYKHFADKREILLAAYETWETAEWEAIAAELRAGRGRREVAARIVERTVQLHTRWRGLRAAVNALIPVDPEVRRFHRAQRRRQLDLLAELRRRAGVPPHQREDDALLLFTMERVCDAIAQGELRELGIHRAPVLARLRQSVEASLR